jgi:hypothetical protein
MYYVIYSLDSHIQWGSLPFGFTIKQQEVWRWGGGDNEVPLFILAETLKDWLLQARLSPNTVYMHNLNCVSKNMHCFNAGTHTHALISLIYINIACFSLTDGLKNKPQLEITM